VDLTLEPATIAYALLLALVAAALIGLLPALKVTGVSVRRGLQGITSTGGTMKFGGIWSFIVGAQVACTLLFVPAAVGIFTNTLHDQRTRSSLPLIPRCGWARCKRTRRLIPRMRSRSASSRSRCRASW